MPSDKAKIVKVVEIGYALDVTAHSWPIARQAVGYGVVTLLMGLALRSSRAAGKCLFVIGSLLVLFVLEPIPYQVSSMLPLFLFPLAGLLEANKITGAYMNDDILTSISSILVALIVMKSPLSRRAALWLLCWTGVKVKTVMLSVMSLVFFVSMFVSSTMTTGLLVGFIDALIFEIYANNLRVRYAMYTRETHEAAPAQIDFVFREPASSVDLSISMEYFPPQTGAQSSRGQGVGRKRVVEKMVILDKNDQSPQSVEETLSLPPGLLRPIDAVRTPEERRKDVLNKLEILGVNLGSLGLRLTETRDTQGTMGEQKEIQRTDESASKLQEGGKTSEKISQGATNRSASVSDTTKEPKEDQEQAEVKETPGESFKWKTPPSASGASAGVITTGIVTPTPVDASRTCAIFTPSLGALLSEPPGVVLAQSVTGLVSQPVAGTLTQPNTGIVSLPTAGVFTPTMTGQTSRPLAAVLTPSMPGLSSQPVAGMFTPSATGSVSQPVAGTLTLPMTGTASQRVAGVFTPSVAGTMSQPVSAVLAPSMSRLAFSRPVTGVLTPSVTEFISQPIRGTLTQPPTQIASQRLDGVFTPTMSGLTSHPLGAVLTSSMPGLTSQPLAGVLTPSLTGVVSQPMAGTLTRPITATTLQPVVGVFTPSVAGTVSQPLSAVLAPSMSRLASHPVTGMLTPSVTELISQPMTGTFTPPITGIASPPVAGVFTPCLAGTVSQPLTAVLTPSMSGLASHPVAGVLTPSVTEFVSQPMARTVARPISGIASQPVAGVFIPSVAGTVSQPLAALLTPSMSGLPLQPADGVLPPSVTDFVSQRVAETLTPPMSAIGSQQIAGVFTPTTGLASQPVAGVLTPTSCRMMTPIMATGWQPLISGLVPATLVTGSALDGSPQTRIVSEREHLPTRTDGKRVSDGISPWQVLPPEKLVTVSPKQMISKCVQEGDGLLLSRPIVSERKIPDNRSLDRPGDREWKQGTGHVEARTATTAAIKKIHETPLTDKDVLGNASNDAGLRTVEGVPDFGRYTHSDEGSSQNNVESHMVPQMADSTAHDKGSRDVTPNLDDLEHAGGMHIMSPAAVSEVATPASRESPENVMSPRGSNAGQEESDDRSHSSPDVDHTRHPFSKDHVVGFCTVDDGSPARGIGGDLFNILKSPVDSTFLSDAPGSFSTTAICDELHRLPSSTSFKELYLNPVVPIPFSVEDEKCHIFKLRAAKVRPSTTRKRRRLMLRKKTLHSLRHRDSVPSETSISIQYPVEILYSSETATWDSKPRHDPSSAYNPLFATDVAFKLNPLKRKMSWWLPTRAEAGDTHDLLSRSSEKIMSMKRNYHIYGMTELTSAVGVEDGKSVVQAEKKETSPLQKVIFEEKEKAKGLRAALLLALAYATNFGATASGGSTANVYLRQYITSHYLSIDMTFFGWWVVHFPFSLVMMIVASSVIQCLLVRNYDNDDTGIDPPSKTVIMDRLDIMGHATYREFIVGFLFVLSLILLVFRDPFFMPGWALWLGIESEVLPDKGNAPILEWTDLHKRLPWGVIFLLGGAATISTAIEENGLYESLEQTLLNVPAESVEFLQYLVVIVIGCLGEVTTQESRLKHFIGIGGKLAKKFERRPLYFLLPINIMCQFSLILPSSAPGNAMAFEMGSMTSLQMIMPGILIKVIGVVLYMIIVNSIALTSFSKEDYTPHSKLFENTTANMTRFTTIHHAIIDIG
ncbi:uncharacterized protein LOC135396685 isoform X2 [Ornithodoros turicata]|uniref:uncharacterized protein LOC135396685 isoform X2 n=1 Tax=Ornithodoros turicata TaxID=34597 RepID=UPI003139ACAB